ncbi:hypothetical protein PG984_015974 [Apiospora sp. TS-2023a]
MCRWVLEQTGGNKSDLDHAEALVRASWEKTVGDDEQPLEGFSEVSGHLRAGATRLHIDGHLVRAMNVVSSQYQGMNFPAAPAPAENPRWSLAAIPQSLVAIPQRLMTWASNSPFMTLLTWLMFFFFVVATIAEGAKYAQWAKANDASRALFAENRQYVCVSAPHISFFVYMVRQALGIPRLD